MRTFIVMRRIDTRTDQAVADIITGTKSCLHIRSVMRIDVNGITEVLFFCNRRKSSYQIIIVRSSGIFGTDRYHSFGTDKISTDTTHINGDHFLGIL